jgi:tetratricopeptide (TPR) repeat protein
MSGHLERARLLLAQSRPADAEREAMQALAGQPDDPEALAVLALSRVNQKKFDAAIAVASEAVGLAPGISYFHYVHGLVLHHADRRDEAFRAAQEALRLEPSDPDHFSLLSAIELSRGRWPAALEAAEQALALNAEHVEAANFRAMALVRLGRKAEAVETVDFALQRAPENAMSHANQGWNNLHRNDPKAAQEHFREALRLDPQLEYAREGMLEALKARNPVYRVMLAYFLWMGRQSTKLQVFFVLAVLLLSGSLTALAAERPLFWIPFALLYLFIYLSWTAMPLFNLLLRLDRFGRYVLSPDQVTASNWFGGTLLAAAICLAGGLLGGGAALVGSLLLVALSICVAATFNRQGRARAILALGSVGLAAIGLTACVWIAQDDSPKAGASLALFRTGFLLFQVAAMFLRR